MFCEEPKILAIPGLLTDVYDNLQDNHNDDADDLHCKQQGHAHNYFSTSAISISVVSSALIPTLTAVIQCIQAYLHDHLGWLSELGTQTAKYNRTPSQNCPNKACPIIVSPLFFLNILGSLPVPNAPPIENARPIYLSINCFQVSPGSVSAHTYTVIMSGLMTTKNMATYISAVCVGQAVIVRWKSKPALFLR